MNKTETTSYTYNKETDTLTTTITTTISFPFTHYHRDLILKAYRQGYVEIRGDLFVFMVFVLVLISIDVTNKIMLSL